MKIVAFTVVTVVIIALSSVTYASAVIKNNDISKEEKTKSEKLDKSSSVNKFDSKTEETGDVFKILSVLPYQGISHQMFFQAVEKILLKAGHHVTTVSTVQMKETFPNHRQISFKPTISSWSEIFEFDITTQSGREARIDLEKLSEAFMFPLYESKEFRQLLTGNEQFDLVILEPFFMQEALVFLGHRFNCPVISLSTANTETNQDHYMGRTRNPALEAEWTVCQQSPTMTFYERAMNTFSWIVNVMEHRFYYVPKRENDLRSRLYYPGIESLPPIRDLLQNISLTLANTHQLLQNPVAVPPNLIMVPGLHIRNDNKLPQDLENLIESAKDGIILFAMGTMTPVSKMREEREIFIEAFSKLPQLVLWKSDIDLEGLPSNIKTFKWLPQQAILGHSKCQLFITHGGMLGKQEALYNGVPLVSIPLFGDQPANTGHSQASGLGLTLQYDQLSVNNLHNAITEVINNKEYKERLRRYSEIFRESVSRSEGLVLEWVHRVIRQNGCDYLRANVNLYWFQYYLLDVWLLFVLSVLIILILLIRCAQAFIRIRFPASVEPVKSKKQ